MALKTRWLISKSKSCSCTMPGVWRAVAFCRGCAVILHSPRGCAHVADTMDVSSMYRALGGGERETLTGVPLISSDMREKDSIFGGADRLQGCIRHVVETYHPECLVVASSCVSGVIGDDIEAAAEEAEAEFGIPVVAIDGGGFLGGEYYDGYFLMLNALIDRFLKPQKTEPGTVLLLGDGGGPWGQYASEVRRLLSYFGLTVKWHFPGYVPVKEWEHVTAASLIVLLGGQGSSGTKLKEAGDKLSERFGIPSLGGVYPIGWEQTGRWIRALAAHLDQLGKGKTLIAAEEEKLKRSVDNMRRVTEGKTAVIGIGRPSSHYDPSDTIHTVQRMGLAISAFVLFGNLSKEEREIYTKKIRALSEASILDMGEGQRVIDGADILLSTHEITNTDTRQIFIPMVPMVGSVGEEMYMQGLYRLLCRYGKKGGMTYV